MRRRRYLQGLGTGVGVPAIASGGVGTGGSVSVAIVETTAPVEGGDFLEITADIENGGRESVRPTVDFVVGDERVGTRRTTVDAGESTSMAFDFGTYPVANDDEFPVRVEAAGAADERSVRVSGVDELPDAQVRPDRELAVRPGTPVMFEAESTALGEYGGRTRWFVDGTSEGMSMGPWYAEYYAHCGAEYWQHAFESAGSHNVVAAITGDEGNYRASWTVDVSSDGVSAPTVEAARPAAGALDPARVDELAVDVSDSGENLDRVVWWLGHSDVVLGETSVAGASDTATLSGDSVSGCHGCPVVVWAICADGTVATGSPWTFDPGRAAVAIRETNAPVVGGDDLAVTVELENGGGTAVTREVRLIVGNDPERVDATSVALDPGARTTATLGYETYPVARDQEFPVRVETDDDADERTVLARGVDEDASLRVEILGTNAPVEGGENLDVTAAVENPARTSVSGTVRLVVGHDPERVDATSVTLDGGDRSTVTLGYESHPVARDQTFPVRVETDDDADERSVTAYGRSG